MHIIVLFLHKEFKSIQLNMNLKLKQLMVDKTSKIKVSNQCGSYNIYEYSVPVHVVREYLPSTSILPIAKVTCDIVIETQRMSIGGWLVHSLGM